MFAHTVFTLCRLEHNDSSKAQADPGAPCVNVLQLKYSKIEKPGEHDSLDIALMASTLHMQLQPSLVQAANAAARVCSLALRRFQSKGGLLLLLSVIDAASSESNHCQDERDLVATG